MRFAVEQWSPEYATPIDDARGPDAPAAAVEEGIEQAAGSWAPVPAGAEPAACAIFVDGVQRIDGWIWIQTPEGTRPGICGSYAAGAVRCDGAATVIAAEVRRGVFTPAAASDIRTVRSTYVARPVAGDAVEQLRHAVGEAMSALEGEVAARAAADAGEALLVLDGPIRAGRTLAAIGMVKRHHARYLSDAGNDVVSSLAPGERTPLFIMKTSWTRYSWYLRLPGGRGHDWAGIVRCEAPIDLDLPAVLALAGRAAATLPRFASQPEKDARAPQNLYPIGGLERHLRHRLGDPALLYRELVSAGAKTA